MTDASTAVKKLFAGIITFNPDIPLLERNIAAVRPQVELIVIVDNHSENIGQIKTLAGKYHCEIICNNQNKGIAAALNQATRAGEAQDYEWMLSLDQDSECPVDFCSTLSSFFTRDPHIAIVAPIIRDRKNGIIGHRPIGEYGEVRTCITSGSCTRLTAWNEIGGYDEKLFIDSVDFDFCYRLRKVGYKVIQTDSDVLEHFIGEAKRTNFFNLRFQEHSAFRYYYIARNNIYYPKKNHLYIHMIRGYIRNLKLISNILLFEKDKKAKIKSILRGWIVGIAMRAKKEQ